jgi:hypothetical protein
LKLIDNKPFKSGLFNWAAKSAIRSRLAGERLKIETNLLVLTKFQLEKFYKLVPARRLKICGKVKYFFFNKIRKITNKLKIISPYFGSLLII